MGLDFASVARPDGTGDTPPDPGPEVTSDDLVCQVCGAPLMYGGRGPKPKFCDEHKRNRSTGTTSGRGKSRPADVERACDALDNLYSAVTLPLFMVSPRAGRVWVQQVDGVGDPGDPSYMKGLSEQNRTYLANNRKLVDRINKGGEKASTMGFVLAHVFAIAPTMLALRVDLASRRSEEPAPDQPRPRPGNVTPLDPEAAFRP